MEDPSTMQDKPTWELVTEQPGQDKTDRLRVTNGWVYRSVWYAGATTKASGQVAVALAFVPDETAAP
jgi:hypothetical protein